MSSRTSVAARSWKTSKSNQRPNHDKPPHADTKRAFTQHWRPPGQWLAGASPYELMLAKLETDKRRLKAIQSVVRKIAVKREVLPEDDAYVSGALEGGRRAQDDVLMTVMIWRVEAGDYAGALVIARYAMRHRLCQAHSKCEPLRA